MPAAPDTLVDVLRARAASTPDRHSHWLQPLRGDTREGITYGQLDRRARAVAVHLLERVQPGDRVLLAYPPGLDYIAAFYGCLYAGVVAVPASPPRRERDLARWRVIAASAGAELAMTVSSLLDQLEVVGEDWAGRWLVTDGLDDGLADDWRPPASDRNTLAFLQYTSGSTGAPKGVMITHHNLLANAAVIDAGFQDTPDTRVVSWLPHYHDMGLIGCILQPVYMGVPVLLMSPVTFIQRPIKWLRAISDFGATTSGAPNFGYELAVLKHKPEHLEGLDLSRWSLAFIGAEPIRVDTLRRFADTFTPAGFRWEAFHPCYGLAESTLCVTNTRRMVPPVVEETSAHALERDTLEAPSGDDDVALMIGVGAPMEGEIRIVDVTTRQLLPDGDVGEIWVRGESVSRGYWEQPEASAETFGAFIADTDDGPWVRTGDLGVLRDGSLFVTGRIKEMIIIRGANHYPHDIEHTVQALHPALTTKGGAAFSVDIDGEERLVVVQEIHKMAIGLFDPAWAAAMILQAVADAHGLRPHEIVIVHPFGVPKTTSGKVRRRACRSAYLAGELPVLSA